jgi:hypothetical protein
VDGVLSFDPDLGPRPIAACGLWVAGGTQTLEGYLYLDLDVADTVTLHVTLRPYGQANRDFGSGLSLSQTLTAALLGGQRTLPLSLVDLTPLGDPRYDRECELVVWQDYVPAGPVTSGSRLVAVYLDAGLPATVQAGARDATRLDLPRQAVSVADIKTGAILGQDVGRKMRATHNALLRGMLGRAPGLKNTDDTPDLQRPYIEEVHCAHQHRGIDVPDGCGGYWSDGVALRDTYFAQSFYQPVFVVAPVVQNQDYRGALIHSGGALDATWIQAEYRVSIPAGLGAMELRFSLEPAAQEIETRLLVHVDVRGEDGVSICTGLTSGNHRHADALDAGGLYVCEVDPLDNDAFEPSRKRRLTRKGLWTRDARRLTSLTSIAGVRDTAQLVSEVVRVNLTHPKINASDPPHATTHYRVLIRWELQVTGGVTSHDPGAQVRWVLGYATRGF